MIMEKNYRFETLQIHAGQKQPDSAPMQELFPFATTSYSRTAIRQQAGCFYEPEHIYQVMNPTTDVFEKNSC